MYLKFLIFYIIALVTFLPYLSTDAKKLKNKNEDETNDLAEIDNNNNDKALVKNEEKEESKGKRKDKHIVKQKGNTNIHIHIHHLPPHCGPVKPKPPRPGKTTTRRTKSPKPPSGGKTTPGGPTTTTRKTKSPKPPSGGKTTPGGPTTTRTKKPKPPSGGKTTPGGPTTTTRKTKSPKPPSGGKTTPGGPTTTTRRTKKPKPPSGGKTTPGGSTTTTGKTKSPKPPSGGKTTPGGPTTTTRKTKSPKPPSGGKTTPGGPTTTTRKTKSPKPPSGEKTTPGGPTTTTRRTKKPKPPSGGKTTPGGPTTTTRKTKSPKPPSGGKTTPGGPITTTGKTKSPKPPSGGKTTPGGPTTTTGKTKSPKPPSGGKTTPGGPTTTTRKTKRTKKPKTTPSGPTTTTGNGKPPVKPPAKPTPKPPSDKKTTTPRSTKRTKTPPRSTTPRRTECDDWRDYYYERYHSTIKINVTEYIQTDRCQEKCYNVIFGKEVYDYYRHLEILRNKKTVDFVKKLNKLSYKYLSSITIRNYIERKIISFSSYPKFSIFEKHGQFVYYKYRRSSENQDSIWRRDGYMGKGEIFLNISEIDNTGKTTIVQVSFSRDDKYMAYAISVSGSNLWTIKFKETDKKYSKIKDELKYVFSPFMGFAYETKGFFYSAFVDKKGKLVTSLVDAKEMYHALFYHRFGTKQENDILIDVVYDIPNVFVHGWVSHDERMLFVRYSLGNSDSQQGIKFLRLHKISESSIKKGIQLEPLFTKYDAHYSIVDSLFDEVILLTTKNAPNGRVVKINIGNAGQSEKYWKDIIRGDSKKFIKNVQAVGQNYLYINYMENVTNKAFIYDKRNGRMLTQLDFETSYHVEFSGSIFNSRFFIRVINQVVPQIIYTGNTLDLKRISKKRPYKLKVVESTEISGIEKKDYVIKTVYYQSFDKTMVPMFIFHRKNMKLDGQNPVLLESYGAFGISSFPTYSPSNLMFVTHFSGIYVIAGIRGGGEYGEEWHKAGAGKNKNNTFNDFIVAAEYLIKKNYTRPAKLAIRGGTNGGLLAAVVSRLRPDLFGSVIMGSPLLDMVRYNKLNFGLSWNGEYGNPDNKEDFEYLLRYSPYHNIKMPMRPVQWPCTLILTSLNDQNVHAAHTLKYTAELYHVLRKDGIKYQRNPVLVSVTEEEKQTTTVTKKQIIKTTVDEFSFVKETLNIKWKYSS
uniref:Prolyl endopeptidase n=1 Tax=Strongyloides papillosus TaxID=174720 RepID=A0A0N5BVD6_STREA